MNMILAGTGYCIYLSLCGQVLHRVCYTDSYLLLVFKFKENQSYLILVQHKHISTHPGNDNNQTGFQFGGPPKFH